MSSSANDQNDETIDFERPGSFVTKVGATIGDGCVVEAGLNDGHFAVVLLVKTPNGELQAAKVYNQTASEAAVQRELKAFQSIDECNDNVIKMIDDSFVPFEDGGQTWRMLRMPTFETDLSELFHTRLFQPKEVYGIMRQVLSGVHSLHHFGWLHLDLKAENIVLKNINMKNFATAQVAVCDVGSLTKILPKKLPEEGYTTSTSAPELVMNIPGLVGPQTDVFSLACLFFELLTSGHRLFPHDNFPESENKAKEEGENDDDPPSLVEQKPQAAADADEEEDNDADSSMSVGSAGTEGSFDIDELDDDEIYPIHSNKELTHLARVQLFNGAIDGWPRVYVEEFTNAYITPSGQIIADTLAVLGPQFQPEMMFPHISAAQWAVIHGGCALHPDGRFNLKQFTDRIHSVYGAGQTQKKKKKKKKAGKKK